MVLRVMEGGQHGMSVDETLVEQVKELARRIGFEYVGACAARDLRVRSEVRDMCASDKCHAYNRNWSCPPACGSLEHYQAEFDARQVVVLFQTFTELEDSFDIERMVDASELHDERFCEFVQAFCREFGGAVDPLFLGAGACTVCPECAYPDEPCRFPQLQYCSMEASGLVVADACASAGVDYNHGPLTLAYSAAVVF